MRLDGTQPGDQLGEQRNAARARVHAEKHLRRDEPEHTAWLEHLHRAQRVRLSVAPAPAQVFHFGAQHPGAAERCEGGRGLLCFLPVASRAHQIATAERFAPRAQEPRLGSLARAAELPMARELAGTRASAPFE